VHAIPARVIATSFAIVCFVGAIIVGLAVRNSLEALLLNALVIMFISYVIGSVAGGIAQRTVDDHIDEYKQLKPIPDEEREYMALHGLPDDSEEEGGDTVGVAGAAARDAAGGSRNAESGDERRRSGGQAAEAA